MKTVTICEVPCSHCSHCPAGTQTRAGATLLHQPGGLWAPGDAPGGAHYYRDPGTPLGQCRRGPRRSSASPRGLCLLRGTSTRNSNLCPCGQRWGCRSRHGTGKPGPAEEGSRRRTTGWLCPRAPVRVLKALARKGLRGKGAGASTGSWGQSPRFCRGRRVAPRSLLPDPQPCQKLRRLAAARTEPLG